MSERAADPREDKLPSWARTLLAGLRADVERLAGSVRYFQKQAVQAASSDVGASTVRILVLGERGYEERGLPDGCTVRFYLTPYEYVDVQVMKRVEQYQLELIGNSRKGNHQLHVIPAAANRVTLVLGRD